MLHDEQGMRLLGYKQPGLLKGAASNAAQTIAGQQGAQGQEAGPRDSRGGCGLPSGHQAQSQGVLEVREGRWLSVQEVASDMS